MADTKLTTQAAERKADLARLKRLVTLIERAEAARAALYDERREIWERRLTAKDTTKSELSRASEVTFMAVTIGVDKKFTGKS